MAKGQSNYVNNLSNTAGTGPLKPQQPVSASGGGFSAPVVSNPDGSSDIFNNLFPGYSGAPAQAPITGAPTTGSPSGKGSTGGTLQAGPAPTPGNQAPVIGTGTTSPITPVTYDGSPAKAPIIGGPVLPPVQQYRAY
jgi:hypothetical protein